MSRTHSTCRDIEAELVAVGAGEAPPATVQAVEAHVAGCAPCRDELRQYRALEGLVADVRRAPLPGPDPALARAELEARLADLRRRLVTFGIFSSPLGPILIGRSAEGVSMVEYLESRAAAGSRLAHRVGPDAVEDEAETEALYRDLLDYLDGRRTRLDWPLDLRMASSDFQRRVLQVTSKLPYGAVTSYAHIAREIGAPTAVRAVAQALRWNPVPIARCTSAISPRASTACRRAASSSRRRWRSSRSSVRARGPRPSGSRRARAVAPTSIRSRLSPGSTGRPFLASPPKRRLRAFTPSRRRCHTG